MAWQVTPYAIPPLAAAVVSGILVLVAWRHRERRIGVPFGALMFAVGAWSLAYAIQIGYTSLPDQLFWWRVGLSIAVTIPPLWLVLTLQYAQRTEWLTRWTKGLLAADPIVFAILLWTDDSGLFVRDATLGESPTVVELTFGTGYLVHTALAYLLILAGIVLLLRVYLRSSRLYRRQAGVLVAGAVVPLGANAAFTAGVSPVPELDLTTFAFTTTGVLFGFALFRFDLLERTPILRRRMIDELGDGFVVLGDDERVVEANANARRILDAPDLLGRPATTVLRYDDLDDLDGAVVPAGRSRRFYQVRHVPLGEHREEPAGYLIALRDVTDREEYEQRLEVANRLLRHNLRNETNVILAHADALRSELGGEQEERARKIETAAERIADLSEKAGQMEETLRVADETPTVVDVGAIARRTAARFRSTHPEATISFDGTDESLASVIDPDLLDTAIGNLIENAIEHHGGTPRIRVSVDAGDRIRIRVADDGSGIPAMEYEVLSEGRETALKHGSGVGLWLVHWVVSASGGELRFEDNDPVGTIVTIELSAG